MIGDGEKYHYLAVTNLSALLQKISSNHKEDFYCLNCFNSYTTKNKLKEHEEICNNHDSCRIEMPKWVEKILKYNPGEKSLKAPFAIYLHLECLLKKEQSRENNDNDNNKKNNNIKKSDTEEKAIYELSSWAMFTRYSFDKKEKKLNYYRGRGCTETLCKKLKECAMKITNYKEKEMITLTKEENMSYKEHKCHICEERFCMDEDDESYTNRKKSLKIIVITQENLEELLTVNTI